MCIAVGILYVVLEEIQKCLFEVVLVLLFDVNIWQHPQHAHPSPLPINSGCIQSPNAFGLPWTIGCVHKKQNSYFEINEFRFFECQFRTNTLANLGLPCHHRWHMTLKKYKVPQTFVNLNKSNLHSDKQLFFSECTLLLFVKACV